MPVLAIKAASQVVIFSWSPFIAHIVSSFQVPVSIFHHSCFLSTDVSVTRAWGSFVGGLIWSTTRASLLLETWTSSSARWRIPRIGEHLWGPSGMHLVLRKWESRRACTICYILSLL
ncbi:hypothetical protein EV424DRAFT_1364104 [Suillus variegatus]|nr:hypothetical protein EV424DRAFT_1459906 [Suillus variegatus]KAG1795593.1 hypothetical protein EV424DRAFT_1446637 [Suillus variegatus]KAG1812006.1 hypothetical protein EV424DRAFT_1419379 [Suillus variegatus]KAG1833803.1 hypothetical protein EV424DRAFT_1364104 [Suillus variegatus]